MTAHQLDEGRLRRRCAGHGRRGVAGLAAVAAIVLSAGGCTTETVTSDGRPLPPEPRRVPEARPGLVPTRMSLIVAPRPDDADGDGWPDTIHATAAFFAPEHPLSIETEGVLRFTLWRMGEVGDEGAEPIAAWAMSLSDRAVTRTRAIYGPCYRVSLDLQPSGGERLPAVQGDLRAAFEPAATPGERITASNEVRSVQIGRN